MPLTTPKTVWKTTALPIEIHDDASAIASAERRAMGDILGEILAPILRQRLKIALKNKYGVDIKLKRQEVARKNGAKR